MDRILVYKPKYLIRSSDVEKLNSDVYDAQYVRQDHCYALIGSGKPDTTFVINILGDSYEYKYKSSDEVYKSINIEV